MSVIGIRDQADRHLAFAGSKYKNEKAVQSSFLQNNSAAFKKVKYSDNNLKAYYLVGLNKLSFGHRIEEDFKNWGVTVNNGINCKLWAPKFWAPELRNNLYIEVRDQNDDEAVESVFDSSPDPLKLTKLDKQEPEENCIFKTSVKNAKPGDYYRFVEYKNGKYVPLANDPYSMWLDKVNGWSKIYDHDSYDWNDQDWQDGKSVRIQAKSIDGTDNIVITNKKLSNKNPNLTPISKMVIEEIHIGTLTKEGDFEAAKAKIQEIAEKGIANTVEFMPVESEFSRNWGYDGTGSGKFSPTAHYCGEGGPDKLKELIDESHKAGLNVIMDLVPNHMAFSNNFIDKYDSGYTSGQNGWGNQYNIDNPAARNMLVNMSLNWLINYHCDGLRLDMTKYIGNNYDKSNSMMKEIAEEVHYHCPDAILIAEDARDEYFGKDYKNCYNGITIPIEKESSYNGTNENIHSKIIQDLRSNKTNLGKIGFDSQWGFPIQHYLYSLLTGQDHSNDYRKNDALVKLAGDPSRNKAGLINDPSVNNYTNFFMSHDEIGNVDGTRLISKIINSKLNMYSRVEVKNGDYRQLGHIAAQTTQRLLEDYYKDDSPKNAWNNQDKLSIKPVIIEGKLDKNPIKKEEFKKILDTAIDTHRLALGTIFVLPGSKMIFQGDEYGALETFKFFRNEPPDTPDWVHDKVMREKGYDYSDIETYNSAKLDRSAVSYKLQQEYDNTENYSKSLARVFRENPALNNGKNDPDHLQAYAHSNANVLQVWRKDDSGNEIIALMNFGDQDFCSNYKFGVINPVKGGKLSVKDINNDIYPQWKEIINSKKNDDDSLKNPEPINSDEKGQFAVNLPSHSLIIMKRVS